MEPSWLWNLCFREPGGLARPEGASRPTEHGLLTTFGSCAAYLFRARGRAGESNLDQHRAPERAVRRADRGTE